MMLAILKQKTIDKAVNKFAIKTIPKISGYLEYEPLNETIQDLYMPIMPPFQQHRLKQNTAMTN